MQIMDKDAFIEALLSDYIENINVIIEEWNNGQFEGYTKRDIWWQYSATTKTVFICPDGLENHGTEFVRYEEEMEVKFKEQERKQKEAQLREDRETVRRLLSLYGPNFDKLYQ